MVSCASSPAATQEGPRLALIIWSLDSNIRSVVTIDPSGAGEVKLLGGPGHQRIVAIPFAGPSWSPNGDLLAFGGYSADGTKRIFFVAPNGSALHAVPGTRGATNPILSPDGRTLAFSRERIRNPSFDPQHPLRSIHKGYFSTTTWALDLASGRQRQLTKWHDGLHNMPSSFSPDGSLLALTRSDSHGPAAIALDLVDGSEVVLARDAEQPAFSPDGTSVALISYRDRNLMEGFDEPLAVSELYVKSLDGGELHRLTYTHDHQESSPSWDPSGERLAYTQSIGPEPIALGFKTAVMQVNANGTCPKRVIDTRAVENLRSSAALYGPVWQPSPGREASPIAC